MSERLIPRSERVDAAKPDDVLSRMAHEDGDAGSLMVSVLSDTCQKHERLHVAPGHLLIFAGDWGDEGTEAEAEKFLAWFVPREGEGEA